VSLNTMGKTIQDHEREFEMITSPDKIHVSIPVVKKNGMWLPNENGKDEIWADFRKMTVDDYWTIESLTKKEITVDGGKKISDHDIDEAKALNLKFMLLDWNMSIDLCFDESGWITEECHKKIMLMPGPIMEALVSKYQDSYMISVEEEKQIDRQCSILFSKNSRGVENAAEAITLFCVLGNFWEKFGINRFDLKKLPYKEYVMLRMVLSREIDNTKRSAKSNNHSGTRIAGPGGRTRPSRGVTIESP